MEQRWDSAPWASAQNCPPSPAVDELSAADFLPPSRRHPSQSLTRMENLSRSLRRQILQRQHDRAHAKTRAPLVASLSTYSVRPSRPHRTARRPRLPFAASRVVLAGADETCAPAAPKPPAVAAVVPDIEIDPAVAARVLRRLRGSAVPASPPCPRLPVVEAGADTACVPRPADVAASAPDIEIDPAVAARIFRRLRGNVEPSLPPCAHLPVMEAGTDTACASASAPDTEIDPAVAARVFRRLRGNVEPALPPCAHLPVMEPGADSACAPAANPPPPDVGASAPELEIDPAVAARVFQRLRGNVVPDFPSYPHLPAMEIDSAVKAGTADIDEGLGEVGGGDDDKGDPGDEYRMLGRGPPQHGLIGTMRARGIVRFDTSAEAALRCPQLVKNVPRMRKRKHLKREHRGAAQESI